MLIYSLLDLWLYLTFCSNVDIFVIMDWSFSTSIGSTILYSDQFNGQLGQFNGQLFL